ncbi:MAG: T9SS type A sorting domain-containing protein, partial [Candidatus Marinimicrobia bacterium]|nr:T9SS type A sorting domain-containing protein [Candidatus Neomarinimicrobiota bacterium]MBT3575963.1 T9SS type A sorting domain-containing protein [Candidatus Neomarinimicrobiota bacterium]MBT3950426.1 T9SS type A sorting domain-containing protein [Candidatus Neomarinimicrobiota bacterium]MBT5236468.1 T9SS type A sorting domain-containing protein [Candidatus Neomarinimicrobiota bacterium]MBT5998801.1 T9SS type A sorting domain-containing protein [Candidatus Neomarinimicrobiota bacterium]
SILLILLLSMGFADFDADGVDLVGRYTYGYCPNVQARGEYVYSSNGTVFQVLDIHTLDALGEVITESIVSGIAISGNYAYIANWSDGFKVIDITDPAVPVLVAQIDFPGQCWDISVSGDYAYLGNDVEGLRIIDISNPLAPTHISTFVPVETAAFEYTQVIDTIAYAASKSGLYILNVSDPSTPVQLGYSPAENGSWSVAVVDTIAFLPEFGSGIRLVNVADPTNPIELGYFPTPDQAYWVEVVDTLAYVAERWSGIQILDISDLTAPDSVGMFPVEYADGMHIQGDSLYLASSSWGLKQIDISDGLNPVLLNENPGGGYARDIYTTSTHTYVTLRGLGVGVFIQGEDVEPEMIALLEMDNPNSLNGSGDYLYVIEDPDIHIIDVSDPLNPQIVSTWYEGAALTSYVVGHLLFVGGNPDIQILDISDASNPVLVGVLDGLPWVPFDIKIQGRFAYVVNRGGGFWIIDIADPTSPETVSGLETFDYAWRLDVSGQYAYIADRYSGSVRIIDISDPTNPFEISDIGVGWLIQDVVSSGRYVYGLSAWDGVRIIDCADAYNPVEVGYFNTGGYAQRLHAADGIINVADGGGGFYKLETAFKQQIFTVNSTGDDMDANPGDGICDDGTGDCTLRAAINEANATPGYNEIAFNMEGEGPHSFVPNLALPWITESVLLDGSSQPGYAGTPLIAINGSVAGTSNGLVISTSHSTVKGLAVGHCGLEVGEEWGSGILIRNGAGNVVQGCFVGLNTTGSTAMGNTIGVYLENAKYNLIGGLTPESRNVISANYWAGIDISAPSEGGKNHVLGNYIGLDHTGTTAIGNGGGINLYTGGNLIGGPYPGAGNVISGNYDNGLGLSLDGDEGEPNVISGNFIGTDHTGTLAVGNGNAGVMVGSPGNIIGGSEATARNIISGNLEGVTFAGEEAINNSVQGNYIGTDVSGNSALGNTSTGILILSPNNHIGGTPPGAGNLISGNQWGGISIGYSGAPLVANGNTVQGNLIGTDQSGTLAIPNYFGVIIDESASNNIGGNVAGSANIISGNTLGVVIRGSAATDNTVSGNLVGTNLEGTEALGNDRWGIQMRSGASNNLIGGTSEAAANVIGGNGYGGVGIGWDGVSTGNVVQGNIIGSDRSRTLNLANSRSGISIYGAATDNLIGGDSDGAGNLIVNSELAGININSTNNEVNNRFSRNMMHSNGEIGIDLSLSSSYPYTDGVTENDEGDGDDGPNHLQNFPASLNVGVDDGGDLLIQYLVDSDIENSEYPIEVEFFLSDEDGEGQLFLYSNFYTTANHELGLKTIVLGPVGNYGLEMGDYLVATATDAAGNTSEFSHTTQVTSYVGVAGLEALPTEFTLEQNYPNPFNPSTTIRYGLPETSDLRLTIYDLHGRVVQSLSESNRPAGWVNYEWSGTNMSGEPVSTGVYLCRLEARNYTKTIKMVFLK